jgi:hypothetical protein
VITLYTGDCLTVPWQSKRNAWVCDPPANIAFMGRKWDLHASELGFAPPLPPRSKEHLRELQSEFAFQRYWGERFALMFDQSEDDAVAFVWALPRTAHLTQTALRWAGWRILDSWHHVFGQGWPKDGGHLKPAHEVWFVAIKGKPRLNIDAGRVARGERQLMALNDRAVQGATLSGARRGASQVGTTTLGSHPPNVALSHHPACMRIGERKVRQIAPPGKPSMLKTRDNSILGKDTRARIDAGGDKHYGTNGTESLPAYSCAVSCPCGRHWIQPSGGSPSECECGRMGEWVCPVAELDEQSGQSASSRGAKNNRTGSGCSAGLKPQTHETGFADQGGASRYFPSFGYYAKASGRTDNEGVPRGERHAGCEELYWRANKKNLFGFDRVTREEWEELPAHAANANGLRTSPSTRRHDGDIATRARGNVHPTVKGIEMMMYLIRISGGDKIGDLCFGSGGTAIAADILGHDYEGAELCPEAVEITRARLAFWSGLPLQALETFKLTGEMPEVKPVDSRQVSLF